VSGKSDNALLIFCLFPFSHADIWIGRQRFQGRLPTTISNSTTGKEGEGGLFVPPSVLRAVYLLTYFFTLLVGALGESSRRPPRLPAKQSGRRGQGENVQTHYEHSASTVFTSGGNNSKARKKGFGRSRKTPVFVGEHAFTHPTELPARSRHFVFETAVKISRSTASPSCVKSSSLSLLRTCEEKI